MKFQVLVFSVVLALISVSPAAANDTAIDTAGDGAAAAQDLKLARRCAWRDANGRWVEAGECEIEGWQGPGELLLTVRWPSGQRSVIETLPEGGQARINRRRGSFQPAVDGTWLFRLQQGGALRFTGS